MASLARGFCAGLLSGSFSEDALDEYKKAWPLPMVQVVDLQRYPGGESPHTSSGPARFYVAVSDSESLLWLIVPPGTGMEEMVASFQLDVGCCLTLDEYAVVTVANGHNVLILLRMSFSSNPLSLIGDPQFDPTVFQLSARALTRSGGVGDPTPKFGHKAISAASDGDGLLGEEIVLRDLVERPECAMRPWWVALRVVWLGTELAVQSKRFRGEGESAGTANPSGRGSTARCMQKCVGVDANGHAMLCVFWRNGAPRAPRADGAEVSADDDTANERGPFGLGDCVQLHRGSVLWGAGEAVVPMQLQFSDRSFRKVLSPMEAMRFPVAPAAFLGSLGEGQWSVQQILEESAIDDAVSVTARVRYVDHGVHVNTKRGRVLRVVVSVEDPEDPNAYVDVTFWGEHAEAVRMNPGEVWYFSNCTVREFMRRKTLSSRSRTVTILCGGRIVATAGVSQDPAASPALCEGTEGPKPPHSQLFEQVSRPAPHAATNEEEKAAAAGEGAGPSMQFVFRVGEATPTLPALVRIQSIEFPITVDECVSCRFVDGAPDASQPTHGGRKSSPRTCGRCGRGDVVPVFSFSLVLSDGCECVAVRCVHGVGVTLLEMSARACVEEMATNRRDAEDRVRTALVGIPVLAWLFTDPGTKERAVIACKYVNVQVCARVLLSTIDTVLAAM